MTSTSKPRIAIVGYGSQGRAHALNLRDSGFDVTVGLRPGGPTELKAKADGFTVKTPAEAVKGADRRRADPRHGAAAAVRRSDRAEHESGHLPAVRAWLQRALTAMISPREDLDVVLVAPKGPGALVRREYEIGRGVPCIYAVYQDRSGNAEQLALAYCAGIGGARANAIKTSFKEETETDLFGEQAVLCGGASLAGAGRLRNPGRSRLPAGSRLLRSACTS
jgi:ketol-acid reductoisomerase